MILSMLPHFHPGNSIPQKTSIFALYSGEQKRKNGWKFNEKFWNQRNPIIGQVQLKNPLGFLTKMLVR